MDYSKFSCVIRGKEYEFCIDHNEEGNLVSMAVVKEFNLAMIPLPYPYYVNTRSRQVRVHRQAWVPVEIKGSTLFILCDVFPLKGEALVLGQAWLDVFEVRYNSAHTRYHFSVLGKTCVLDAEVVQFRKLQEESLERMMRIFDGFEEELKKTMTTHFVDTCATVEELKSFVCAPVEVVSTDTVAIDVNVVDDVFGVTMDAMAIEEEVITKVESVVDVPHVACGDTSEVVVVVHDSSEDAHRSDLVHQDPPLASHPGLLNRAKAAPILHTDVLALVDMDGKSKDVRVVHIYHDPFLVHCTPFVFIVADWFVVHIRLDLRTMAIWFASLSFMAVHHFAGLIIYVQPRLLFDPGGFEDESFRTGRE